MRVAGGTVAAADPEPVAPAAVTLRGPQAITLPWQPPASAAAAAAAAAGAAGGFTFNMARSMSLAEALGGAHEGLSIGHGADGVLIPPLSPLTPLTPQPSYFAEALAALAGAASADAAGAGGLPSAPSLFSEALAAMASAATPGSTPPNESAAPAFPAQARLHPPPLCNSHAFGFRRRNAPVVPAQRS